MQKNKFWNFAQKDDGAELTMYGEISDVSWFGDEVTPKLFKQELDKCKGDLTIYINSPGGDVFAGMAIHNMISRYEGKKKVCIDGLAASIASVIAMAGDEIIMPENAMMMIHNAWTTVSGNKEKLIRMAEELTKVDGVIAEVYAKRGGKTCDEYAALMEAETWFTAKEAMEAGLIDTIEEGKSIAAKLEGDVLNINDVQVDLKRFRDGTVPRSMAAETADTEDHSNGGESQPVDDNNNIALEEQRKKFNEAKLRIAERKTENEYL